MKINIESWDESNIQYLKRLIHVTAGNLTCGAKIAKMSRTTFYRYIDYYNLREDLNAARATRIVIPPELYNQR